MDAFFKIFVGQPLVLLAIAALFFIGYFFTRSNPNLRAKALLTPAVLWLLWAVWEWIILRNSPEADLRIDLLLIFPIVFIVSIVGIFMLFRRRKA